LHTLRQKDTTQPRTWDNSILGQDHQEKQEGTYRFLFINHNGIPYNSSSFIELTAQAQKLKLDWLGVAETHLDTKKPFVQEMIRSTLLSPQGYTYAQCVSSASDVDFGTAYKPGGVLQISVDNLATRTIKSYADPYGRFTSQTFTGRNNIALTTIAGYRVIDGHHGPMSASEQQRVMLTTEGRMITPRKAFIEDLIRYILDCQDSGHEILLMLDANESMHRTNSGINRLTTICGLTDVYTSLFPDEHVSSFKYGSDRIDFCLASPLVLASINRAGILPFDVAFSSDHRPMFLDINVHTLFKGVSHNPIDLRCRSFTTKNEKRSQLFVTSVSSEWTRRNMTRRIGVLANKSLLPTEQINTLKIQRAWDKLDKEIGRIFHHAEGNLKVSQATRSWSPELARAGAVKRYWKSRWNSAIKGNDTIVQFLAESIRLHIDEDWTNNCDLLAQRYDEASKPLPQWLKQTLPAA
jgi:hypothetical protein